MSAMSAGAVSVLPPNAFNDEKAAYPAIKVH